MKIFKFVLNKDVLFMRKGMIFSQSSYAGEFWGKGDGCAVTIDEGYLLSDKENFDIMFEDYLPDEDQVVYFLDNDLEVKSGSITEGMKETKNFFMNRSWAELCAEKMRNGDISTFQEFHDQMLVLSLKGKR